MAHIKSHSPLPKGQQFEYLCPHLDCQERNFIFQKPKKGDNTFCIECDAVIIFQESGVGDIIATHTTKFFLKNENGDNVEFDKPTPRKRTTKRK